MGGGYAIEGTTGVVTGIDDPDDLAGFAMGVEAGIGVPGVIGITIGGSSNGSSGGGSVSASGGPATGEGHLGITLTGTYVFPSIDELLAKLEKELRKKKVSETDIKKAKDDIRKKVGNL